ncbi:hypothetical protein GCM10023075_06080 [Streptosporangium album]
MRDHQRALAVLKELLEHHDLAELLEPEGLDHVERLVEHDLLATPQRVGLHRWTDIHPKFAAPGEDLHRAVFSAFKENAEAGWRLRQPVDLLLQGNNLVPGLLEGGYQTFVLAGDGREVRLYFMKTLFEDPGLPGRLRQLPT